jgi:transcriptional regulator
MYIPAAFRVDDRQRLHDFIEGHNFGLLVSTLDGVPFATHLPFLLERDAGPNGCLVGHLARANPQWQQLDGQEVLLVFSGPHAYVSPTWYEADDVVPTWNYVAVHAYGVCRVIDDPAALTRIVADFVSSHERAMPQPWLLDTGSAFVQQRVRAVVGFRVEVGRLEGKWKLNQNQPEERRVRAARALAQSDDPGARAVARLMGEE